jgi:hypothetical protein
MRALSVLIVVLLLAGVLLTWPDGSNYYAIGALGLVSLFAVWMVCFGGGWHPHRRSNRLMIRPSKVSTLTVPAVSTMGPASQVSDSGQADNRAALRIVDVTAN